jgi:two-component system, OmpR family, response regulator
MRLLVVEDEDDLRDSLEQVLKEEGYAVDVAGDGDEGWFKASSWTYDAVLLDVMLPVIDGWEILRRIRAAKLKTPVLMLTARDAIEDRVRGLDLGSDDYVVKPFELSELLARVRALIRRAAGETSSVIEMGPVHLDTAARVLKENGQPVELTAREYSLVEMLAMHRGRVVSRSQLYDHLFSEEEHSLSNLLDVHVCNVRKKLKTDLILTRRGHGYIIEGASK